MDNLTHSLVGAVLGQTGLKTKTRKGMAALVLGANGPDIDVFFGWVPWLPLATHRGFTHGVIGTLLVMPLVVSGFLWMLDRWQECRGERYAGRPPMHFGWLLGLAVIGTLTHPLLDLQTSYAVQLLSPISAEWFHTDSLFIIDLGLLAVLGGSFWISRRRERKRGAWQRVAATGFAVLIAYIGANLVITSAAKARVRAAVPKGIERLVASPPPLFWWRRDLVWLRDGSYHRAGFDPLETPAFTRSDARQPANMTDMLVVREVSASPEVQKFLRWSIMPFAVISRERCQTVVTFNDARYSNGQSRGTFERTVTLPTKSRSCP